LLMPKTHFPFPQLNQLAKLYGIQTSYIDMHKRRQEAHPESVLLALRALGSSVTDVGDAGRALAEKREELRRRVEPVIVAWAGHVHADRIKLSPDSRPALVLEDGSTTAWPPPCALPHGYHRLRVRSLAGDAESLVISAPIQACFPVSKKTWGAFAPLYALHSKRSLGAGDLTDFESLMDWISRHGGRVLSTLPLLASFLDEPFEPSPYSPISRLFWNEFYIDPTRAPEFNTSPEAQHLVAAAPPIKSRLVDYRATMKAKRRVLELLAKSFFEGGDAQRRDDFQHFVAENPEVLEYARFRARTDQARAGWHDWPDRLPHSERSVQEYHLYAQWMIQSQLQHLATKCRDSDCMLYLDLPLGLHRDSFDTWRYPDLFVKGVSGGAPPDPVFTTGQDWAFQPIHPEAMRQDSYRYMIAYIRNHLRYAKLLRIDHVMGLHRLYWIPEGFRGDRGLYVDYPAEEMYAIFSLESHRAGAGIVGENLGLVPANVNRAMQRHDIRELYVAQYETVVSSRKAILRRPTAGSVASLNTHDMFPFQAFLNGDDIDARVQLGFLTAKAAAAERKQRRRIRRALAGAFGKNIFEGCMAFLRRSKAAIVLENLEDLWGETKPQNIPATTREHANWRRRMRYSMERLSRMKNEQL
jgi:4-alpha-glucanotransferase